MTMRGRDVWWGSGAGRRGLEGSWPCAPMPHTLSRRRHLCRRPTGTLISTNVVQSLPSSSTARSLRVRSRAAIVWFVHAQLRVWEAPV